MSNRLTRAELCEYLPCSNTKLFYLLKSGLIPNECYYSIGKRKYFITSKIDEWIEKGGEYAAIERQFSER